MKTILKTIIGTAALLISAAACDKWTEQRPVDFDYLTIKDKNPALYESYMQSIRDYHATEHQVLIARFDNKDGVLSGRADHLTCLPDSVDYVVLNNADLVSAQILEEMNTIATEKSIPTLIPVDYEALMKELNLYIEDVEAQNAELEEGAEPVVVDKAEWLSAKASAFTAKASEYGVAGIMVCFEGINPLGLNTERKAAETTLQEAFFAPLEKWVDERGGLFFFQGAPTNLLIESDILSKARYIIIPAESVTTVVGLDYKVGMACGTGVPTDRFVIGVTAFDVTDETATDGLFSGGISAIEGAGRWAVSPASGFSKKGVCVNHAQFDYYNITNVYSEIGKAIATMNPSPVR